MSSYEYLFYSLYKFFIRLGRNDIPERKAIIVISLWTCLYLLIPYGFIDGVKIPKYSIYIIFLLVNVFHFNLFIRKRNYLRIYRKFERDEYLRKKYKNWLPFFYMIAPFVAMLLFAIFRKI